jgi:hypothetical protein
MNLTKSGLTTSFEMSWPRTVFVTKFGLPKRNSRQDINFPGSRFQREVNTCSGTLEISAESTFWFRTLFAQEHLLDYQFLDPQTLDAQIVDSPSKDKIK